MKFPFYPSGQLGLLLALSVMGSSCNQEEFFLAEEFLVGEDAFCYKQAPDLTSCQRLVDRCQPAFWESADESREPIFLACVANPDYVPAGNDEEVVVIVDGSNESDDSMGSDSSSESDDSTVADNSDNSNGSDDTTVSEGPINSDVPTIEEAYASNCKNLDPQYLWTKKTNGKRNVTTVSKVKVCHMTGNGSSHTILIACPALKAHITHHDDYLGSCIL